MHIMTILILTMFLDIYCLPSYHWLMHPILSRDSHSNVVSHKLWVTSYESQLASMKRKFFNQQNECEINPANAEVLLKKACHLIRAELFF